MRGPLLGFLLGTPRPLSQVLPVDGNHRLEDSGMVGAGTLAGIDGPSSAAREDFLETGFVVLDPGPLGPLHYPAAPKPVNQFGRFVKATVEIHASDHGLHRVGEYRVFISPAGSLLGRSQLDI